MAGCKVIALHGGAGSGKSYVADLLKKKHNAYVIKADEVAHRLYKRNQPGYKAIIRICGKGVLDENKDIDRKKLGELLYKNPILLSEVNHSIHPMVYAKTVEAINAYKKSHKKGLVVFEAALLPERPLEFIDEKICVSSSEAARAARMKETRNYTDEKISSILLNQPSDDEYRYFCDYTIENNGTLKVLEDRTDEAIKYCQRQQR